MLAGRKMTDEIRRVGASPKPKAREGQRDTPCKNVTIYGHCRFENSGCPFNHNAGKSAASTETIKKRLNVDSPSFRPAVQATEVSSANVSTGGRALGLSPKAANAAPFEPKTFASSSGKPQSHLAAVDGNVYANKQYNPAAPDWSLPDVTEFIPSSSHLPSHLMEEAPIKLSAKCTFRTPPSRKNPWTFDGSRDTQYDRQRQEKAESERNVTRRQLSPRRSVSYDVLPSPTSTSCGRREAARSDLNAGAHPFKPLDGESPHSKRSRSEQNGSFELPFDPSGAIREPPPTWPAPAPFNLTPPPARLQAPQYAADGRPGWNRHGWSRWSSPIVSPVSTGSPIWTGSRDHHRISLSPSHDFFNRSLQAPLPYQTVMSHAYPKQQGAMNENIPSNIFDPYGASAAPIADTHAHQSSINPYSHDAAPNGNTFFQQTNFAQPIQYHLYAPMGPHRENLLPYQRAAHDFFIPDALREELQRKSAATLQTLPNTSNQKNASLFGYPSWVYKAVSSRDGNTYCLRRLEGFRLTNENAIRSVRKWKGVSNGNIVSVMDAFTNRGFGDSSLMIATEYFPLARTLTEAHLPNARFPGRAQTIPITEQILWAYLVQITNALKAIHGAGLAARIIDPTKILLTSKNRIRLNACGILDIVQFDQMRSLLELQRDDLAQFGRLLLDLGIHNANAHLNAGRSLETFARTYSPALKERVAWLLAAGSMGTEDHHSIDQFVVGLEGQLFSIFDAAQHSDDQLTIALNGELENSRITRLMIKLNSITERPDWGHERSWAETGERFPIKLFRDYVFHQVDASGAPVLDLGFILDCLNKLDAGIEEKLVLTSRDEQIVIVVTYREMKRAIDAAWGDLTKAARRGGGI